jgi:hypothetical protein
LNVFCCGEINAFFSKKDDIRQNRPDFSGFDLPDRNQAVGLGGVGFEPGFDALPELALFVRQRGHGKNMYGKCDYGQYKHGTYGKEDFLLFTHNYSCNALLV